MTNADHIRAMTDEELAKCLSVNGWGGDIGATLDWLQQPYEGGEDDGQAN